MSFYAHPTAVIDEGCKIGDHSKIWHFCHIMTGAELGDSCILGQNVFVGKNVTIGNGVKVQNNVSLYTGVTCEDDVFIGPSAVFTNVINPRSALERKDEFKPTRLRKGATIGANATVLCGTTIGKYAMVGAGAVVTKDVPDFAVVVGNPAKKLGWMSKAGYRLKFDADGIGFCPATGEKYARVKPDRVVCEGQA